MPDTLTDVAAIALGTSAYLAACTLIVYDTPERNAARLQGARAALQAPTFIAAKLTDKKLDRDALEELIKQQRLSWGRKYHSLRALPQQLDLFCDYLQQEWFTLDDLRMADTDAFKSPGAATASPVTSESLPETDLTAEELAELLHVSELETLADCELVQALLTTTYLSPGLVDEYQLWTDDNNLLLRRMAVVGAEVSNLYATTYLIERWSTADELDKNRKRIFHPDILAERLAENGAEPFLTVIGVRRTFMAVTGLYYLLTDGDLNIVYDFLQHWLAPSETADVRIPLGLLERSDRKLKPDVLAAIARRPDAGLVIVKAVVAYRPVDWLRVLQREYNRLFRYTIKLERFDYPEHVQVWSRGLDFQTGTSFPKVGRGVDYAAAQQDLVEQILDETWWAMGVDGSWTSLLPPKEKLLTLPSVEEVRKQRESLHRRQEVEAEEWLRREEVRRLAREQVKYERHQLQLQKIAEKELRRRERKDREEELLREKQRQEELLREKQRQEELLREKQRQDERERQARLKLQRQQKQLEAETRNRQSLGQQVQQAKTLMRKSGDDLPLVSASSLFSDINSADRELEHKFRTLPTAYNKLYSARQPSNTPFNLALTPANEDLYDIEVLRRTLHLNDEPWTKIPDTAIIALFQHDVGHFKQLELEGDLLIERIVIRLMGARYQARYRTEFVRNSTFYCLFQALGLCCRVQKETVKVKDCADTFEALIGLLGRYAGADLARLQDYVSRWWFPPAVVESALLGERLDQCQVGKLDVRTAGLNTSIPCDRPR